MPCYLFYTNHFTAYFLKISAEESIAKEKEQEQKREEAAWKKEREDRRMAEEGLLPVMGEMWKLGKSWKTGGLVRLWHKCHFLLENSTLHYYTARGTLLKSPQAGGLTSPNATPRSTNRTPSRSPLTTPRSILSKLSDSFGTPRGWYKNKTPRTSGMWERRYVGRL